jgi:phosphate uptake regulator
MGGGAYESDLLNLREQAMRHRGLASNRLFRMPTFLPKIDESTSPREPADDAKQAAHRLHRRAIKMYAVSHPARQYSGRFSVVALLARLWRPF